MSHCMIRLSITASKDKPFKVVASDFPCCIINEVYLPAHSSALDSKIRRAVIVVGRLDTVLVISNALSSIKNEIQLCKPIRILSAEVHSSQKDFLRQIVFTVRLWASYCGHL